MIQIKINDPETCRCAANWCKCNVNKWNLKFDFGSSITYIFEFMEPVDATHFALKWVQ